MAAFFNDAYATPTGLSPAQAGGAVVPASRSGRLRPGSFRSRAVLA